MNYNEIKNLKNIERSNLQFIMKKNNKEGSDYTLNIFNIALNCIEQNYNSPFKNNSLLLCLGNPLTNSFFN
ncbi:MAG: hypothetical protein ACI93S_000073 [Ancylomarina sp.]|jgi:hypothetical protein